MRCILYCMHTVYVVLAQGRVLGTRQLSPLEVGEDNSKFKPKKLRKIHQIHQYGQTKG